MTHTPQTSLGNYDVTNLAVDLVGTHLMAILNAERGNTHEARRLANVLRSRSADANHLDDDTTRALLRVLITHMAVRAELTADLYADLPPASTPAPARTYGPRTRPAQPD